MTKDRSLEYKELLDNLRHLYKQKYDIGLDDEILYLIIRINELQVDLKNEIKGMEKVAFRKGADYLWYGLGKSVGYLFIGAGLIMLFFYLFTTNQDGNRYEIFEYRGRQNLLLKNFNASRDTAIDITLRKTTKE